MSWLNFSTLANAWLFLLALPLILFYFLKLRRPHKEVSSLVLWQQVMDDQRVNSPFQKFKKNLLLLLQLLLLCSLILASMQPFIQASSEQEDSLPILIDCSASMGSIDSSGKSRLDVAKDELKDFINKLLPGQRISLISFHSTARRLTEFTDNKRVLLKAVDSLETVDVPGKLEDALRLCEAMSRVTTIKTVYLLSDGNLPNKTDFELPFSINYQKLPTASFNIGITECNARRANEEGWDLFIRVEGNSDVPVSAKVEIWNGLGKVAEDTVLVSKELPQRVNFRLNVDIEASFQVKLISDGKDSLEVDNYASIKIPKIRKLQVFVSEDLTGFRHALNGISGLVFHSEKNEADHPPEFDLLFTDKTSDDKYPSKIRFNIGLVPEDLKSTLNIETGDSGVEIIDWLRNSTLLQHVNLGEVISTDVPTTAEGSGSETYEEAGYEIFAHSTTGPVLLGKRDNSQLNYYLLFHTDRSTFPYRVGFPVLVNNLVQIAMQEASLTEVHGEKTGALVLNKLIPGVEYIVSGPNGFSQTIKKEEDSSSPIISALKAGEYRIKSDSDETKIIGVSLLNSHETLLKTVESIQFSELSVDVAKEKIKKDQPTWKYFAFFGFLFLIVEWWYFQRRPGRRLAT